MRMAKKVWWISSAVLAGLAVVGVATVGVAVSERYGDLEHGPAFSIEDPDTHLEPARAEANVDNTGLAASLDNVAATPALGTFGGQVTDAATGEVVWAENPDRALTPASATKVLTSSAALLELDRSKRLTTEVVAGETPGTVVIRTAGDVWLTPERISELAEQIGQADTVLIDTSAWTGPTYLDSWDDGNVDGGYVAPMKPAMLHQGRISDTEGDVPRSHTPALDVAAALAQRLGADFAAGSAPADAEVLATTTSPTLIDRVTDMMLHSDNVMAEAIARELAIERGRTPDFAGATAATLAVLQEHGFDTSGTQLRDNSGLSPDNLITPALLDALLHDAATGSPLADVLRTLPVAGGEGTLADRYGELAGRGWVRAKTGTLTGTSALAGVVTADSGRVYTFALLSNDAPILQQRAALDTFASTIRAS